MISKETKHKIIRMYLNGMLTLQEFNELQYMWRKESNKG